MLVCIAGIVCLAKYTAHRIAGPYLRIVSVCNSIRDGDMDQVVRFRGYDRLDYVSNTMNEMIAAVRARTEGAAVQDNDQTRTAAKAVLQGLEETTNRIAVETLEASSDETEEPTYEMSAK